MDHKKLPKLISKSKIYRGLHCEKAFYLSIHHRELETKPDENLLHLFDQVRQFSDYAKSKYLEKYPLVQNVDLPAWEFVQTLKKTEELLNNNHHQILSAGFEYKGCFTTWDFIVYNEFSERWTVYDFKLGTKPKPEHIDEIALQSWITANAGLKIEKIILVHMNSEALFPNLENFLVEVDVTQEVRDRYKSIPIRLNEIFQLAKEEQSPKKNIGEYCEKPFPCSFKEYCWKQIQWPKNHIFQLPQFYDLKWKFYEQGILDLDQIDLMTQSDLKELHKNHIQARIQNQLWKDSQKIRSHLSVWQGPFLYLDFETISFPIPQFNGTRAFEQVPVQFCALATDADQNVFDQMDVLSGFNEADPRQEVVHKLIEFFCRKYPVGSIVAYNSNFEGQVLQQLADVFPESSTEVLKIKDRLVDPYPIIKESVYDPKFLASFSLKSVAPALLGEKADYKNLQIQNGLVAQKKLIQLLNHQVPLSEVDVLRKNLIQYCAHDVYVLKELVNWLQLISVHNLE